MLQQCTEFALDYIENRLSAANFVCRLGSSIEQEQGSIVHFRNRFQNPYSSYLDGLLYSSMSLSELPHTLDENYLFSLYPCLDGLVDLINNYLIYAITENVPTHSLNKLTPNNILATMNQATSLLDHFGAPFDGRKIACDTCVEELFMTHLAYRHFSSDRYYFYRDTERPLNNTCILWQKDAITLVSHPNKIEQQANDITYVAQSRKLKLRGTLNRDPATRQTWLKFEVLLGVTITNPTHVVIMRN